MEIKIWWWAGIEVIEWIRVLIWLIWIDGVAKFRVLVRPFNSLRWIWCVSAMVGLKTKVFFRTMDFCDEDANSGCANLI